MTIETTPPLNELHKLAILIVDYLTVTGVLKDAEALRREGEQRERARQRKKTSKKKVPAKKAKRKAKR